MYIKSMVNSINPLDVKTVERATRSIKADESHDRDANGQQTFGEQEQEKPPMSDEQIEKAIEALKQLPAAKEHKWTFKLVELNSEKFVQVKDNLGKLIRTIPEKELWSLSLVDKESPKGHLLKRTA